MHEAKKKQKKKERKAKSVKCPLFCECVRMILCMWEQCCTLYLVKPSIVNFLIMPPWFHIWTELQHINHQSVCVCMCMCVCAVICDYLCAFLCDSGSVLLCFTAAAPGSVCLLDWWQTGVLFISWWRITDDSFYESMSVYQPEAEEASKSFTWTCSVGLNVIENQLHSRLWHKFTHLWLGLLPPDESLFSVIYWSLCDEDRLQHTMEYSRAGGDKLIKDVSATAHAYY